MMRSLSIATLLTLVLIGVWSRSSVSSRSTTLSTAVPPTTSSKRAQALTPSPSPSSSRVKPSPSLSAEAPRLERLEGDSALAKTPKRPLNAKLSSVTPSPRDASWRPGQTLPLGWQEAPLPHSEGRARVRLSLSAESAEGYRVAAALRPRVLKSLYHLLNHRASGSLTLPDAEERLARDLNERLKRMSAGYQLEVHVEGLELHFD